MDIQLNMILFQIFNFGIILAVLWYLLYRPILKIFAERAKRVEEGQRAAAAAIKEYENIEQLKTKTERQLKEQAALSLKEAADEGKKRQDELVQEAKTIAQAEIEKLRAQWQAERDAQTRKMQQSMVDAVFQVCNAVLPQALDSKNQQELIDKEVAGVLSQL